LDAALVAEIVESGRMLGSIVSLETDDDWFTDRISEPMKEHILHYGLVEPEGVGVIDDVLKTEEIIDKVSLDLRELDEQTAAAARASVHRVFGERANVSEATHGVIDVVSPEASKAAMAQRLARRVQIPAEQTMAIDGGDNDASLLQWAGIGVAMGNATPAAKAAADVITSSNLRDGVAEALEQWILGQKSLGSTLSVPNPALVAK
jgi:hydroxymethylpyrimidine pyrophosphatase-like HAD family hydrolase